MGNLRDQDLSEEPETPQRLRQWLEHHDQRLFAARTRVAKARKMAIADLKEDFSPLQFRVAAARHCKFFRSKRKAPSRSPVLDSDQWEAVRAWIRRNGAVILDAENMDVIVQLMRLDGVPSSKVILANSATFREYRNPREKPASL